MTSTSTLRRRIRKLPTWWRRYHRNSHQPDRCDHCGHRFRLLAPDPRHANGSRDGRVWHGPCMALLQARTRAAERLAVLDTVVDLAGLTARDVIEAVELTAPNPDARVAQSNRAWRVFRDLEDARTNTEQVGR